MAPALSRLAVSPATRAAGILAFALLTALGAFVRIPLPFTPVPVTLQTFFVLAAGIYLGSRDAALSQLGYLAIGAVGLPVFAGGGAGFGHFLGVTGGYLIAFPIAAAMVGAGTIDDRLKGDPLLRQVVDLFDASVVRVRPSS